jgi:hypothetical protein
MSEDLFRFFEGDYQAFDARFVERHCQDGGQVVDRFAHFVDIEG